MMTYPSFSDMSYYNKYSRYGYPYPSFRPGTKNTFYHNPNKTLNQNTKNIPTSYKQQASNSSTNISTDFNQNRSNNKSQYSTNKNTDTKKTEDTRNFECCDSPVFQLLGISLYFDDILLIILIFFLYQEGVKDDWLFMVLVLLLLS